MWNKRQPPPVNTTLHIPEGYSVEFDVEFETSTVAYGEETAHFEWDLFRHNKHVDSGAFRLLMNSPHMKEEIFIYLRRRVLEYQKKAQAKEDFPYPPEFRHALPNSMEVPHAMAHRGF